MLAATDAEGVAVKVHVSVHGRTVNVDERLALGPVGPKVVASEETVCGFLGGVVELKLINLQDRVWIHAQRRCVSGVDRSKTGCPRKGQVLTDVQRVHPCAGSGSAGA